MTGAATPRRAAVCALRQAPRRRQAGSTGLAFSFGRGGRRKDDAAVLLAQPSAAPVVLEPVVDAETAALRAAPITARVKEVFTTSTSSALSGSIFGLLFGIVSGTVGRKGVGPTLAAAQAQARSWGGVSAVYSGLQTAAKVARAKNDRWNNVIGACGSGAAFSCASGGGPRAAVQGCVSFALFSYVIDGLVPSTGGDPATKTDAELLK